ncbi:M48 family metalloprotease [Xanthobacter sp. KR7-65]|uniref:M48 family metalloprotease n=1 Tax=Xanthobacter sp. KR7-65 TaxID=3156612 RepID=UPI0032B35BC9
MPLPRFLAPLGRVIGIYPRREYVDPFRQVALFIIFYAALPSLTFASIRYLHRGVFQFYVDTTLFPQSISIISSLSSFVYRLQSPFIGQLGTICSVLVWVIFLGQYIALARLVFVVPHLLTQSRPAPLDFPPEDDGDRGVRLVNRGYSRSLFGITLYLLVGAVIGAGVGFVFFLTAPIAGGVLLAPFTGGLSLGLSAASLAAVGQAGTFYIFGAALVLVSGFVGGLRSMSASPEQAVRTWNITLHRPDDPLGQDLTFLLERAGVQSRPEIGLITTPGIINAFAIGSGDTSSVIAISQGLMDRLTPAERRAVLGHELGHVISRDVRRMTFARAFQDGLTWFLVFNRVKLFARGVFTSFSEICIQGMSRNREYWADAMGAALTSPDAMIGALLKLRGLNTYTKAERRNARMMFRASAFGLFASHPPIERRIAALRAQTYIRRLNLVSNLAGPVETPAIPPIPGMVSDLGLEAAVAEALRAPAVHPRTAPRQAGVLDAALAGVGTAWIRAAPVVADAPRALQAGGRAAAAIVRSGWLAFAALVAVLLLGAWFVWPGGGWISATVAEAVGSFTGLGAREAAVAERERDATSREAAQRRMQDVLDTRVRSLNARETSVANRESVVASRETAQKQAQDTLDARSASVAVREAAAAQKEASLNQRELAISRREGTPQGGGYIQPAPPPALQPLPQSPPAAAPEAAPVMPPAAAATFAVVVMGGRGDFFKARGAQPAEARNAAMAACQAREPGCRPIVSLVPGQFECFVVTVNTLNRKRAYGVGRTLYEAGKTSVSTCQRLNLPFSNCVVDREENFCLR